MKTRTVAALAAAAVALAGNASECDVKRSAASAQEMGLSGSALGREIVKTAKQEIGMDYSWGGGGANGPSTGIEHGSNIFGFDCSGLVQYAVYQATNGRVKLPRTSQEQVKVGKRVSRSEMRPGDIIAFDKHDGQGFSHIGIYVGDGKMIHAPQTGDHVRISSLSGRTGQTWAIRRVA